MGEGSAFHNVIARMLNQGTVSPRCLGPEKEPHSFDTGFDCSGRSQGGKLDGDTTSGLFPFRYFYPLHQSFTTHNGLSKLFGFGRPIDMG